MDTGSFIIHIKTEEFYKDIAVDVKKWLDTSNCIGDDKKPLPRDMNKKVSGLRKDWLGGKIMGEIVAFRPKTYSYLIDDNKNDKKNSRNKKMCNKKNT